jgi:hypothetical protein
VSAGEHVKIQHECVCESAGEDMKIQHKCVLVQFSMSRLYVGVYVAYE